MYDIDTTYRPTTINGEHFHEVDVTAREAFDNAAFDTKAGAILVGAGGYSHVEVLPTGEVRFTMYNSGAPVDVPAREQVTIRIPVG